MSMPRTIKSSTTFMEDKYFITINTRLLLVYHINSLAGYDRIQSWKIRLTCKSNFFWSSSLMFSRNYKNHHFKYNVFAVIYNTYFYVGDLERIWAKKDLNKSIKSYIRNHGRSRPKIIIKVKELQVPIRSRPSW